MFKTAQPKISAMDKAMKILAVSPVSEAELRKKLLRAGYPEILVEPAVSECIRRGYVNDSLLANDCAEYLTVRGTGRRMVKMKLLRRGIDRETVDAAIAGTDPEAELDAARAALDCKLRLLSGEKQWRKKREKAFRFMVSRGYTSDVISAVFSEINWKEPEDESEVC